MRVTIIQRGIICDSIITICCSRNIDRNSINSIWICNICITSCSYWLSHLNRIISKKQHVAFFSYAVSVWSIYSMNVGSFTKTNPDEDLSFVIPYCSIFIWLPDSHLLAKNVKMLSIWSFAKITFISCHLTPFGFWSTIYVAASRSAGFLPNLLRKSWLYY